MEPQSATPSIQPNAPRAATHNAPRQAPRQAPRWTLLRRIRTRQCDTHADEVCGMESQIVGVRDQASGQTRIFTVYGSPSGVTPGVEPPPDPDPPTAAPAQARPPAEPKDSDETSPVMQPHARAA